MAQSSSLQDAFADRWLPAPGLGAGAAWVAEHLADLCTAPLEPSPRFRGGQAAADSALAAFRVHDYAARRNEVWPPERRGASGLSPWIRHGLISLPRVWHHVQGGPARDVARFRDELLWQEYARHLYARLGARLGSALRSSPPAADPAWRLGPHGAACNPWQSTLRCVDAAVQELARDGWLPNAARMWLASQWTVRGGARWRDGEERFFRALLDGSRAANRLGWQWTIGTATGRPYGFSRARVEQRAPGLCDGCALRAACPIERAPDAAPGPTRPHEPRLARDPDPATTAGPACVRRTGEPEAIWLTAESLGDADPALAAHAGLQAVFVFDAPLLARLRLTGMRLAFLAETLAEFATRRPLELWRGRPDRVLAGRRLAATFAPVPGFRRLSAELDVVSLHPWPWLARPGPGPIGSYSRWRRNLGVAAAPADG